MESRGMKSSSHLTPRHLGVSASSSTQRRRTWISDHLRVQTLLGDAHAALLPEPVSLTQLPTQITTWGSSPDTRQEHMKNH